MSHRIDLESDIRPVTEFRANAADFLKKLRENRRPMVLTQRGRAAAVLVDLGVYQAMVDELELLRDLRSGLADANAGRERGHDAVRELLKARYR